MLNIQCLLSEMRREFYYLMFMVHHPAMLPRDFCVEDLRPRQTHQQPAKCTTNQRSDKFTTNQQSAKYNQSTIS